MRLALYSSCCCNNDNEEIEIELVVRNYPAMPAQLSRLCFRLPISSCQLNVIGVYSISCTFSNRESYNFKIVKIIRGVLSRPTVIHSIQAGWQL